jgi:hypothetical protein
MRRPGSSLAGLAAAVLLVAACNSSTVTPFAASASTSGATSGAPSAAQTQAVSPKLPPAPTNFTAKQRQGTVPCPSPADASCSQTDLAWQSTADASTWFRVYETGTGEGPTTCDEVQGESQVVLETKPGVRAGQLFAELAVGGGEACYWISAVNGAGESARIPAAGHSSTPAPLPPVPTGFTATTHSGSIPCPSPTDASCSQTDLAWQSSADASTWFLIYEAWTGEGPSTCGDVQADAQVILETKPGARSAQSFEEIATGGGERCLWITAVNDGGESAQVPAAGQ